ncbi:chromate efflux transporter [Virgibacillus sp. W0181]|uniref:chromate efflux transporter n=1 Tax=Virgibacillus sp. W0181 TaxID=3391581 RepID=UPI003F47709C
MQLKTLLEIGFTSLKLGLTSFGGPIAHLGYFKNEYVDKRKWLDDKTYADIIALAQFLPGPASSQVGMAIGMIRGGIFGGVVSWFGFTLPSVIVLVLFAAMYQTFSLGDASWIASLKIVAVAVVAHAVLNLGKKLTPDRPRIAIALLAAVIMLAVPSAFIQIMIIAVAALLGFFAFAKQSQPDVHSFAISITKKQGVFSLALLVLLLIGTPILATTYPSVHIQLFDMFFRVGTLVFGGGHVVLPLLEKEVVPTELLTSSQFLAGYGMAQAVPGPLFTFASYLGAMIHGVIGAIIATVAIFLPSFLLVIGALPFLKELRGKPRFQGMLNSVNASVVGILLAAFYDPVFTSSINHNLDFALAALLFIMLQVWKLPAWLIVIIGVVLGQAINIITN